MKKLIPFLSVVALILIIGSIGAFENNNITMLQCFIQLTIGVGIECFTLKSLEA